MRSLEDPVPTRTLLKEPLRTGGTLEDVGWGNTQHLHYLTHLVKLEEGREGGREEGMVYCVDDQVDMLQWVIQSNTNRSELEEVSRVV